MVKFIWQLNLPMELNGTFKIPPWRLDFWWSKKKKMRRPLPSPAKTTELEVRELSQTDF